MGVSTVNIDFNDLRATLDRMGEPDQYRYAAMVTINNALKQIQADVRGDMRSHLNFKRLAWNLASIHVSRYAKKDSLYGVVQVSDKAKNLKFLEEGKASTPLNGLDLVAIPNSKVFKRKVIDKDNPLFYPALGLQPFPGGILKGKEHTFQVTTKKTGAQIVLQRVANKPKKASKAKRASFGTSKGAVSFDATSATTTRCLYVLKSRTPRPVKMNFARIAQGVVAALPQLMDAAISRAVQTAKKK